VARFKSDTNDVRYYLNDHLGSVVGTVKRNGTLTSATQYSPYGKIYRRTLNDPSFRHAYTGHELDHELDESWYYYGARYYVPDLCLFSQVDPMTDKYPSLSPFLYCADNPMKYVDEDGRIFWLAAAVGALYYLLSTFDMVQTPTDPQDIHIPSTGEKVLQQAFAIGGAFGAMQFTNWGLSKMAPAATDATATPLGPAVERGLANEAKALEDMGLQKNTKMLSGKDPNTGIGGKTMPDAVDLKTGDIVDIKDRAKLSNEKQLRLQRSIAEKQGSKHIIVTGKNTKISGPLRKSSSSIIYKDYLGPQE
jgi:RHS repeat-associated protein